MIDLDEAGSGLPQSDIPGGDVTRRRFIGYLVAGPLLVAGARFGLSPNVASAAAPGVDPTTQLPVDVFDLSDLLNAAAAATQSLITVTVNADSTVSFALPRAEVGQGITTAFAMVIADEIGMPLENVIVSLANATPALVYNQLTGGSNSVHSLYASVRTAAATARTALAKAAADVHGGAVFDYAIVDGEIHGPNGLRVPMGSLSERAAVARSQTLDDIELRTDAEMQYTGTFQRLLDAHEIVTGTKVFAMDLQIPNALPTMLCRPPTINGVARGVTNMAQVKAMPGVTDVVLIPFSKYVPGGVAVRAQTFGQCIDAIDALKVDWEAGTAQGKSDASVAADLAKSELPIGQPPAGTQVLDETFTFHFRPGDPLETNCAIADVRPDSAEIWAALKSPIWAQEQISQLLGITTENVVVHVAQGGGSFGRHLFADNAFEAATVSAKLGKPVKLMWARTDNFRQGRVHPMCTSRVRMTYRDGMVVAYDQRHTSVATDFTQGLGELVLANAATVPGGNFTGFSEAIFLLTASVPYNYGEVTQLLNEIYNYNTFNTSSVRNIYSPDVVTATELMADQMGKVLGLDPYEYRKKFVRDARMLNVLNTLAAVGKWGRAMPAGTAQGIGIHAEYKGRGACLIEIDCRPKTVNRKVPNAYTGPRVTKAVFVVDVGLPINKLGLQAQMMGGMMDGIAQALTYSLHLQDGAYLEGSWDNAYYTRQWNTPPELEVVVLDPTTGVPGGAGELGVAPAMAATACAYARATGTMPTSFPINHDEPLGFTPYPYVPPLPESPTNGLRLKGKPTAV